MPVGVSTSDLEWTKFAVGVYVVNATGVPVGGKRKVTSIGPSKPSMHSIDLVMLAMAVES